MPRIFDNIELQLLPALQEILKSIVKYLNQKTSNIDEAIQKLLSQIAALKEYRQSLISNVVTVRVAG